MITILYLVLGGAVAFGLFKFIVWQIDDNPVLEDDDE